MLQRMEHCYSLSAEFKRRAVGYIERCRLPDGGYFFARIPPSCSADTYFAVKSLALLGAKPSDPGGVVAFFRHQLREGALYSISSIFHAVEVLADLGEMTEDLISHARQHIIVCQNSLGGFGATDNIYVEVSSELEETYQAVSVLRRVGAEFDLEPVYRFLDSFLNKDGGYGRDGHSTLASTFYATAVYRLLEVEVPGAAATKAYLRHRESLGKMQFIEDLYWLAGGLANLGEVPVEVNPTIDFVLSCHRTGGGFARAPIIGIPTLEYTFYALSVLKEVAAL